MNALPQDQRFADIAQTLQLYFDGLYFCDVQRLAQAMHPDAVYATAVPQAPLILRMGEYFAIVEKRESPASRSDVRTDEVLSIECVGPSTALAKVRCSIAEKHYVDLLSLIRVDERWQIIAKVFHYDEKR